MLRAQWSIQTDEPNTVSALSGTHSLSEPVTRTSPAVRGKVWCARRHKTQEMWGQVSGKAFCRRQESKLRPWLWASWRHKHKRKRSKKQPVWRLLTGREGAMLRRSLNKSVKLLSLFCLLGSELELKKEEKKIFFCKVRVIWHKGRAVKKEKARGSSEQPCRAWGEEGLSHLQRVRSRCGRSLAMRTRPGALDEGRVPDTTPGSSLALFPQVNRAVYFIYIIWNW